MSVFDKNFIVKRTWRSTTQSKLYKLSNKGKVSFSERLHLTTVAGKGSAEYVYFSLNPKFCPNPVLIYYQDYDLIPKRLEIICSGDPKDTIVKAEERPSKELADLLGISQYVTEEENSWGIQVDPIKQVKEVTKFSSGGLVTYDISLESNMSEDDLRGLGIYEDLMEYLRRELVDNKIQVSRLSSWRS